MKDIQYTAPNDFRAFCEMLEETGTSMAHHGIKGQHWGVRRFQNEDGTYTEAGKKRYFKNAGDRIKSLKEKITSKPVEPTKTPEEKRNESRLAAAQAKLNAQPLKYNTKYTVRDPVIKKTISAFDELTKAANKVGGEFTDKNLASGNEARVITPKRLATAAAIGGSIGLIGGAMHVTPTRIKNVNWQMVLPGVFTATPEMDYGHHKFSPTSIAAGALLSVGAYAGINQIRLKKAEKANENLQTVREAISKNKNKDPKTGLKLIKGEHSLEEDLSKINPAFNNLSKTTKNNCINCVVSMALRRKGYDVNAGGETILGKHSALFTEMFPKCKLEYTKNNGDGSSFIAKITKMSPESWGYCGTQFKDGGGHAMMYMVKNGKFTLIDPQSGKIYSDLQTKKILSKSSGIDYARLDDVSPDIKKCISRGTIDMAPYAEQTVKNAQRHGMQDIQRINQQQIEETQRINQQQIEETQRINQQQMEETQRINQQQMEETQRINQQQVQQQIQQQMMFTPSFMMFGKKRPGGKSNMTHDIYTAPNDFRAFCEMLEETGTSMAHHGIKGQKHGLRRFQYEDGSLTPAGKERYGVGNAKHKDIISESGQGWERRTSHEKSAIKKTNQKAHAMQDAKAAYKAKKKAFKQYTSEKAKDMDKRVDEVWKIKDKKKRNAAAQELDKHFDKLWNETNKGREDVKAAKQEYKNAKKELHNDVQYAKAKSSNRIRATAAVGLTAAIATGLITKNTDKTTYARNAAIGATAVAALFGGHAINKAKRATNPNIDLTRKAIKNANERQLNKKELTNSKKWVKAGLLAGAAGGAAALGAKKYGGFATDSGKKVLAGGAALGLASLATMERAAVNDARIERRRKQLKSSSPRRS